MKTFLTVKLALAPLVLFWTLLGFGAPGWAIGASLALLTAFALWRWSSRQTFLLELGALATLAMIGALYLRDPLWTAQNALWMSFAGLGLVSLVSLALRRPWTGDYARAAFPDSAGTPQFLLINAAMTGLWGVLFLAIAGARYAQAPGIVATTIVVFGALVSILGPKLALRATFRRLQAARETFHWPTPALAANPARDCDVAIVGAGIGGLTAAALLADAGHRVVVFDQHVEAGGYCHTYLRKARHQGRACLYRFDAGPHDFSGAWPGGPLDAIAQRLAIADRLDWRRVDHAYRTPQGVIEPARDWRAYARQLGETYPADAAGLMRVFEILHAVFEGMYAYADKRSGIPGAPPTLDDLLAFPKNHPVAMTWLDRPFDELVASHVAGADARAVLNALSGYLGDGSERLTCMQMAPIFGYYFKGGYNPIGGSGVFADALVEAIVARGGQVRLKTAVTEILVENGRAAGLRLASGEIAHAGAIVSNADLRRTFLELVKPEHIPHAFRARLERAAPSTSCFSVHLGLDFIPDIKPSLHMRTPMEVGIATMSRLDPSAAPPGHAIMSLITLVPNDQARAWFPDGSESAQGDFKTWRRSQAYAQRKTDIGDRMIAAVETILPDLSRHIVYRADASPVTYARYDWASGGAIYGVSSQGRLKGARSPIPGLVIAGGGNIGAGVEAVAISGAEAAEILSPGLLSARFPRGAKITPH